MAGLFFFSKPGETAQSMMAMDAILAAAVETPFAMSGTHSRVFLVRSGLEDPQMMAPLPLPPPGSLLSAPGIPTGLSLVRAHRVPPYHCELDPVTAAWTCPMRTEPINFDAQKHAIRSNHRSTGASGSRVACATVTLTDPPAQCGYLSVLLLGYVPATRGAGAPRATPHLSYADYLCNRKSQAWLTGKATSNALLMFFRAVQLMKKVRSDALFLLGSCAYTDARHIPQNAWRRWRDQLTALRAIDDFKRDCAGIGEHHLPHRGHHTALFRAW